MKFFLSILSAFYFFFSGNVTAQTTVEFSKLSHKKDTALYLNQPFTGKGVVYKQKTKANPTIKKLKYDTINWVAQENVYNNGVLIKETKYFSENEKHYQFDYITDVYREWYDGLFKTEKLKAEGGLKKRQRHGKWTTYFKDGKISSEGNYTNDQQSGKWTYYHSNGQKSTEGVYKNGQMNGKWTYWDKDGKITSQEEISKLSKAKRDKQQKALEIIAFPFYIMMK